MIFPATEAPVTPVVVALWHLVASDRGEDADAGWGMEPIGKPCYFMFFSHEI